MVRVIQFLISFGKIEHPIGTITWPPEYTHVMSTFGFSDALSSSVHCRLRTEPVLDIRIVSIPALLALKLISWNDNRYERGKDANDLVYIMRNYLEAGQQNRLFESDIMDDPDFELDRAGARLLGRDVGKDMSESMKLTLLQILDTELDEYDGARLIGASRELAEDQNPFISMFESFRLGLREG